MSSPPRQPRSPSSSSGAIRRRSPSPLPLQRRVGRGRGRSSPPVASRDRAVRPLRGRSRGWSVPRLDLSLALVLGEPRHDLNEASYPPYVISSPPVYYGATSPHGEPARLLLPSPPFYEGSPAWMLAMRSTGSSSSPSAAHESRVDPLHATFARASRTWTSADASSRDSMTSQGLSSETAPLPGTDDEVYSIASVVGPDLLGREFSIEEINAATDCFNSKNVISCFGPSVVIGTHGLLGNIAVSSFAKSDKDSYIEGIKRCVFRSQRTHPNVACPIGYCSDQKFHVIYEFQYNCSLNEKLDEDSGETKDVFLERLNISLDVLKGLIHITDGDNDMKLPKITPETVWLRESGGAVVVDMCSNGSVLLTDVVRDYGQLMTKILPSSFYVEGHKEALLEYHKLAEDCYSGDSKLIPSFDSILQTLDRLICNI